MGGSLLMDASSIANSFIGGGGNIQTNVGNGVAATTARVGGLGVSMAKAGGKVAWWGGTKLAEGGKKLKDAYQSRRASSGGRFSGNSGGGSGGGAGGGGGGGTPPLNGGPTVIRGARGEQGAQGAQGERGERGPQGGNGGAHGNPGGGHGGGYDGGHRDSSSAPIPQSMQTEAANRATSRENEWYDMRGNAAGKNALLASVGANERHALVDMDQAMQRGERDLNPYRQSLKEGILADMHASIAGGAGVDEGTVNKALARENELQALRGNPTAKNALLASLGKRERQALIDMDKAMLHGEDLMPHRQALAAAIAQDTSTAALPNPLADVSPERMRAIEGLAKDEKSISNLRSLSQDMSFIEQSKTLNREDFVQAVKNHEWQVEPKRMQAYATDIYDQKNSQDYVEDRTRELLHDTYFGSAATRSTAEELASVMVKGFRGGSQDKAMSKALNELADQVTEAQTHKLTKES